MTFERVLRAALNVATHAKTEVESIRWAPDYAEPGYSSAAPKGVLLANWNSQRGWVKGHGYSLDQIPGPDGKMVSNVDHTMERLAKIAERMGFQTEWSDEWTECDDCGKTFRTSPDSYCWEQSGLIGEYDGQECACLCCECIDPETLCRSREDNPCTCVASAIDPSKYGYTQYNGRFETGFHPGQTDNPKKVYRVAKTDKNHVLFRVSSQEQFATNWECWIREEGSNEHQN